MTVEQEKSTGDAQGKAQRKRLESDQTETSILQTLAEHKGQHLAAEDIFELMKDEYPEMGLATVYRTLQLLYEIQLIDGFISMMDVSGMRSVIYLTETPNTVIII